jgi:phenylacetate-CoA ligase
MPWDIRLLMFNKLYEKLFKNHIYKLFIFYSKSQWMNRQDIDNWQLKKLKDLINYSYQNVPFYKKLWDSQNINIDIQNLGDLSLFPIVDKKMLQQAIIDNEISVEFVNKLNTEEIVWQVTTGSSGTPFKFPVDIESENHKNALRRRIYRWYGLGYDVKWVKLWRGSYQKTFLQRIREYATGCYTLCIYDPEFSKETLLSEYRIKILIQEMNVIQPQIIDGFVSSLVEFSKYIKNNTITLSFKPYAIVTGAELLTIEDRQLIESAFVCNIYNRYGSTENSIIAHECLEQSKKEHRLHIQEDRLIVEIVNEENKLTENVGQLIITDLTSKAMPFIRYRNGDLAKFSENLMCNCGRSFKQIEDIQGRINDFFLLPNGGKITSHLFQNILKKCEGLDQYQVVQISLNAFDINWVQNKMIFNPEDFEKTKYQIEKMLEGCIVTWNKVDNILPGPGGKLRQHIPIRN